MATYNSIISRSEASALIPEDVAREIIQGVVAESTVMTLARRLPNMSRGQQRLPVISALPTAYFVTGDSGLKQTTEVAWDNVYLNAEEIACIVPIPEAVLDDADYDIWSEVRPRISEAMGAVFDAAVLIGTNAPTAWPDDILTAATAASHVVDHSSVSGDFYDEILGTVGTNALVEADGYMVTGYAAEPGMKAALRGLRDQSGAGMPIFMRSLQEAARYELDGQPIYFANNGAFTATDAHLFAGDWSQLVYSLRTDITTKLLTEAVIQDGSGNIVYNLPQMDMVALRVVMRIAWALPNPINRLNTNSATRFPFSVLVA